MKRELVSTTKFEKSFKKFVRSYPYLQKSISNSLKLMEDDLFSTKLSTHKLSGDLFGLSACSCGYDCRIIFTIRKNNETNEEIILLLDIGTHEEVY
jgi:mRNA-degrading endonuclease YafQ of YafQ-DinJ toxin-antitoxin module